MNVKFEGGPLDGAVRDVPGQLVPMLYVDSLLMEVVDVGHPSFYRYRLQAGVLPDLPLYRAVDLPLRV